MKKQVEYLQSLFYDIWNDFGSVYLLVKYSARTVIGKRGFTDEEKKKGLVLVFNDRTNNRLEWDAEGNISCVLAFDSRTEDVSIHHDDLFGIFSPEAGIQFLRTGIVEENSVEQSGSEKNPPDEPEGSGSVVSLTNFKKKKFREPN